MDRKLCDDVMICFASSACYTCCRTSYSLSKEIDAVNFTCMKHPKNIIGMTLSFGCHGEYYSQISEGAIRLSFKHSVCCTSPVSK